MRAHAVILTSCFLILFGTENCIAQAHVATRTLFTSASTATISRAFASASTSGNLIVVHLSWDRQTRFVTSVTDNKGNTYFRINGPTNWHTNYRSELWYAYNIIGGGAPINVTATLNNVSLSYFQIYISEYSGISTTNPLDQSSVRTGSTAAVSSGTITTSVANELVYGVSIGASGLLTPGATFNPRSTANQNVVEDKIALTTGNYNATFTSAGGNWVAELATFKPATTLPVKLISFDAKASSEGNVKLDWVTATEINNDYFEVQRSRDGLDWNVVKKIKGAGTSNSTIHYSATDNTPYAGLSYYRLVQFDYDGQNKSSVVKAVRNDSRRKVVVKLSPNPAQKYLTVEGDYADLQRVNVFTYLGQPMDHKIRMTRENNSKITLELSSLPGGVYILKTMEKCVPFYKQ